MIEIQRRYLVPVEESVPKLVKDLQAHGYVILRPNEDNKGIYKDGRQVGEITPQDIIVHTTDRNGRDLARHLDALDESILSL